MSHGQGRAWRNGSTALSTLCMGAAELRVLQLVSPGYDCTVWRGRYGDSREAAEAAQKWPAHHLSGAWARGHTVAASNEAAETVY
jgi:hypothetical protein